MENNLDSKLLGELHGATRRVLKHHNLTKHGNGVVEADLIYAILECWNRASQTKPVTPTVDPSSI